MLFNSYKFIFLFLPLTLLGFHFIGTRGHHRIAIAWLVGASLFFYGWWNPAYIGLILFSILFNYSTGLLLGNAHNGPQKKTMLVFGIATNLGLLGYFKYSNFFFENLSSLINTKLILHDIILPLAISFFTFQQIAYLVDAYRGEARETNFLHYCLFVTFFPQLVAGPIVHHKEMLPQFDRDAVYRLRAKHIAVGFTIFTIGLFKKVVLADGIAVYASPVFEAAEKGVLLTIFDAWGGAFAYSFQLYFDFSGYSDMAIGLAWMFGIRIPFNFNSPYKATSIIDFWRRWHITLSRFLRDYLYIPLGGNRKGGTRRLFSLIITMLLGGLWHGAGWTFILWGGLHGMYLVINHAWRNLRSGKKRTKLGAICAWLLTMLAVVVTWVPFRADSIEGAGKMLKAMFGEHGISLPVSLAENFGNAKPWFLAHGGSFQGWFTHGIFNGTGIKWIAFLLLVSVVLPSTQQVMHRYCPALEGYKVEPTHQHYRWLEWRPSLLWTILMTVIFSISILSLTRVSEFLYFQF